MDKDKNLIIEIFNAAVKNHQKDNLQDAIKLYKKVIEINQNYPKAYNNLGLIFIRLKDYQKAKDCLKKAIEVDPKNIDAINNLGGTFHLLEDYEGAKNCYKKAIEINPYDALAYNNLGVVFKELGKNLKAIDYFKTTKRIDPNFDCEVSFAEAYLKVKDSKSSLPLLEDYLKKYPQDSRANAYKTIALRGLEKFNQVEKLISFSNLVKKIDAQILTKENIFEFNKELRNALVKDPRRLPEKNTFGWAIRGGTVIRNLFDTDNSSILNFEFFLRKAIDYYIINLPNNVEHPFLMSKTKDYRIHTCWVNFLEPGDYQSNHIHNNGWMSGVYYLDEPEIELNKEHAGWIEFNRSGYNLPHFAGEKGIELIKPKAGMFIFFPSYIWHGTIPYTHKYSRISISFDIRLNAV